MCCHNREQEEQDLVQMGQVRTEEHSGTAEVSTVTDEEGAGVTSSGLAGVPTSGLAVEVTIGSRLAGVVTTSPKLAGSQSFRVFPRESIWLMRMKKVFLDKPYTLISILPCVS